MPRRVAPPASPSPARAWFETSLIVALFFCAAGAPAPEVNEEHYLSRMKHFWDPAWCPGDLFLQSPDAHLAIVVLAGWVTRLAPLAVVAWGGRLLAWTLLAWAWRRLCWRVAPRPWWSVLAAGLWVVGMQQGHLAGEWVLGGVESKCFAYVFVLLALAAIVEDRWNAAWVHLGLATALHALVGGWSVVITLGLWATAGSGRPLFRSMTPGLAVGGLLGLVGVAPPIVMNAGTPPEVVTQANEIYVFNRLPHHLALLTKPVDWLANRAARHWLMLVLLVAASWIANRLRRSTDEDAAAEARRLVPLCRFAWSAAALLLGGLLIELALTENPPRAAGLLRYYWYRLSDVAAPLATAVVFGSVISLGMERRRTAALAAMVVAMSAIVAHLGPELRQRSDDPVSKAEARTADLPAWADACRWIAENTPQDALFLVPKHVSSFRWRAGRAQVATWKDIPQDAASIVAWRRRIANIYELKGSDGGTYSVRSLGHLGAARLRELGDRYGADYVLTTGLRRASLPVRYRNRTYVVYDLGRADIH